MLSNNKIIEIITQLGRRGTQEALISKLGTDGSITFDQLCLSGMVKRGVNGNGERTWKTTSHFDDEVYFYDTPTDEEKRRGAYLHSLGL